MNLCIDCKHHKTTWTGKHRCHRPYEVKDPVSGRITSLSFECDVERGLRVPFFCTVSTVIKLMNDSKCGFSAQYWEAK